MIALDAAAQQQIQREVLRAAGRSDVRQAVVHLYCDVQQEIEQRRPRCDVSGRCCRFEEFGHQLFVTTIELAAFWYELETRGDALNQQDWDGSGCPFQQAKLCGVHAIRPFGCRIFFCDPASNQWQQEQYEVFHGRLKRLHEQLDVPYFYLEWRQALQAIGIVRKL